MACGKHEIEGAVATLRSGGLVAFPTETVYGLGADAENVAAVRRIFEAKGRPATHPVIVHIGASRELEDWAADVPDAAGRLAARFWPGPLTIVLRRSTRVPLVVTGGLETVGLRVPGHPVALDLLRRFGGAVAAPSANRFGSVSPTLAEHVREDLGRLVDVVLDGGGCVVGIESTIVDLSGAQPAILRPGGVSREKIERELGRPVEIRSGGSVRASGQFASHYAPRAEVELIAADQVAERVRGLRRSGIRFGLIAMDRVDAVMADHLVVSGSEAEVARRLYAALRDFDRRGCSVVLAVVPRETGLGLALADRLRRAAGPRTNPSLLEPEGVEAP